MRKTFNPAVIAVCALWLARPAPARALELLPNGKFDAGVETWTSCCAKTGTFAFDPHDASGKAKSGSAKLTHLQPPVDGAQTYLFMSSCLSGSAVQAGAKTFYGAKLRFGTGEASLGTAVLIVEFRSTVDCTGSNIDGVVSEVLDAADARGVWIPVHIGERDAGVTSPAGTKSARVGVVLAMTAGAKLTLSVDDVFAASAGTPLCGGMPATIVGTSAGDILNGTAASDVIVGLGGADQIDGKGGNDIICGNGGPDTLYGGSGDDLLIGGGGADTLYGGSDDDVLRGGDGDDHLYGSSGADDMRGGPGSDWCEGGSDANVDTASACELTFSIP